MKNLFQKSVLSPASELIQTVLGGQNTEIRGTYVHQILVPHIASWISPKFAIKVSLIVNNFVVQEYRDELSRKNTELGQKQDKIDELLVEVKAVREQNDVLNAKLDLANENLIEAIRGVNRADYSINGLQKSLKTTARQSVPSEHIREKDAETFALYYRGSDETENPVYVQCRARPSHLRRRERELQEKYPDYRRVVQITSVPNARTLASEFERRVQERGALFDVRKQEITIPVGFLSNFSEEHMVELAQEVFEERVSPAEEAEARYKRIKVELDKEGKVRAKEEPPRPSREDEFADLMRETMAKLKDIAREFPKDKEAGGWSGKNKTDLIHWILRRRGVEV